MNANMILSLVDRYSQGAAHPVFFDKLRHLFTKMDREYSKAAEYYGFGCQGCADNCCQTRFYHHTYLEYFFVHEGFAQLSSEEKDQIEYRTQDVLRGIAEADEMGKPVRHMCPLNFDGLCGLYSYRPMICRLHGIPHELRKPGQNNFFGPGCGTFDERCYDKLYYKFDRTPFYIEMATLENEFKQTVGIDAKIKLTVAEMIASFL